VRDWAEARRAWKGCGIDIPDAPGEVLTAPVAACLRLNPGDEGEVVWGERIDPARFLILNVPSPESRHRFHDIVLNDGAGNGTRVRDGIEVPVFDELAIWEPSDYSTFRVNLFIPGETALPKLIELCDAREFGLEDWSSIRWICSECSLGNPGPHDCGVPDPVTGPKTLAFATHDDAELIQLLEDWAALTDGAEFSDVELLLAGNER